MSIREQEKAMRAKVILEKQRKIKAFQEDLTGNLKPFVVTLFPP